jgi:hypothetical protein
MIGKPISARNGNAPACLAAPHGVAETRFAMPRALMSHGPIGGPCPSNRSSLEVTVVLVDGEERELLPHAAINPGPLWYGPLRKESINVLVEPSSEMSSDVSFRFITQSAHDERLLRILEGHSTLCLDVEKPRWENARGYLYDRRTRTMYFPVAKKYLEGRDLGHYQVLIWSQPAVIAVGRLSPANPDEDVRTEIELARARDWNPAEIRMMLFDRRSNKPRKNRYKLVVESLRERTA